MYKIIKKRGNKDDDGNSYMSSFSDLMSGLLIVFILLFILKLIDYQQDMEEYKKTLNEKETKIQELSQTRLQIISLLQKEFNKAGLDINVDAKTGAIRLSESILFDYGKSELKPEGKEFLNNFIPIYLNILIGNKDIKQHLSEIIIEGHTDNDSSYIYNLGLSQDRALSVATYLIDDAPNYNYKQEFQSFLSSVGRSYSDLIYDDNGEINAQSSRRVEIKFRLDEDELLLEMQDVLNKVN